MFAPAGSQESVGRLQGELREKLLVLQEELEGKEALLVQSTKALVERQADLDRLQEGFRVCLVCRLFC